MLMVGIAVAVVVVVDCLEFDVVRLFETLVVMVVIKGMMVLLVVAAAMVLILGHYGR